MKNLLIIFLLLVIGNCAFGQFPVPYQNLGSLNVTVLDRGGLFVTGTFRVPIYSDTIRANQDPYTWRYSASLIFDSTNEQLWVRNMAATKWLPITSSGGGGGAFSDTVFVRFPLGVDTTSIPGRQIIFIRSPNGLVDGGVVTKSDCWQVSVTPAIYNLNYVQYTTLLTAVNIDTADATLPRIDYIIVDTFDVVSVLTGTPATTPLPPYVNPSSQLVLTRIDIPAGATCLSGITVKIVYDQNLGVGGGEFDATSSGTIDVDFDDVNNPYHLTKAAFVDTYTDGSKDIFTDTGNEDTVAAGEVLQQWIYLNNELFNQLQVQFWMNDTAVSNNVVINPFLNPLDSNEYQSVSVPFSAFTFSSNIFNKIVYTHAGDDTSGAKGYYIDYIQLQKGIINSGKQFVDSTTIIAGNLYDWYNGVPVLRGAVGAGGGTLQNATDASITAADNPFINAHNENFHIDSVGEFVVNAPDLNDNGYLGISANNNAMSSSNPVNNKFSEFSTNVGSMAGTWGKIRAESGGSTDSVYFQNLTVTPKYSKFSGTIINGVTKSKVIIESPDTLGSNPPYIAVFDVDTIKKRVFPSPGTGTVTSFSAGTLSPLFTTSVATATTTPALTFALSNAAANTVYGNATSGSTAPSFGQIVNGQITNATIVATTKLSATGTPSASTYLRGDDTWAAFTSGTVTSVGLTAPSGFVVSNSPITTSGNIGLAWTGAVQGDLVYFSGSNAVAFLNKDANATRYLSNQGTSNNPSWNQVNLANGVTGTLPVANGGTSAATLTGVLVGNGTSAITGTAIAQGDVFYGSATGVLSALTKSTTTGHVLTNGGSSNNPAWGAPFTLTTTGTSGVATYSTGTLNIPNYGAAASGWSLTGNSGNTAITNFLGTTDAQSLRIRTNNTERMNIDSVGNVGIWTNGYGTNSRLTVVYDNVTTPSTTYATDSAKGLALVNNTAAVVGTNQTSPILRFRGSGLETSGNTTRKVEARTWIHAANGSSNPTAAMDWDFSINGASWNATPVMFLTNVGALTTAGAISATTGNISGIAGIIASGGSGFLQTTRNVVTTSADGVLLNPQAAATSGVPVQYSPRIRMTSNAWNGSANEFAGWTAEVRGINGTTPTTSNLIFSSSNGTSATFSGTDRVWFNSGGNVGIGQVPTAVLHLKAGTATASTAPLKFTSGTNLTTAEDGALEYNGTDLQLDVSTTRYILDKVFKGSGTLDFGSTAAGASTDLTVTVTGAADGDPVMLGVPNGSTLANGVFSAWVSAANTVTVRFTNTNLVAALDPASGTFKATVSK